MVPPPSPVAAPPRFLLLFDIDGTLIRTGKPFRRAFRRALVDTYGSAGNIDGYRFGGKTDPQIVLGVFAGTAVTPEVALAGRAACLERYLAVLREELAHDPPGTVLPGVREILDTAAADPRIALGLLTGNLAEGARLKLEPLDLARYFRFGAYSSDHPVRNELPAIARARAEAATGVRFGLEACFVIGDTEHDIGCARAGGMRAVAVATGRTPRAELAAHRPDYLFDDLSRPAEVLGRLLGGSMDRTVLAATNEPS
ncbi:MAG: HAD family hydrolase [Planctomycetes bacterium]|nr:HAD family hydrolase [Planctomycetota bacterium]